jgi:hypothetical protein
MNQSQDSSPFARMQVRTAEKLSEKMTARKAVCGSIGLALMGIGGLLMVPGVGMATSPLKFWRPGTEWSMVVLGCLLMVLGLALCYAGYWVYCCGQKQPHSSSAAALANHLLKYQDKFCPPVDSLALGKSLDRSAIRSDRNHDTE